MFSAVELILWGEGYPSPLHPPANPARPNLIHVCPHILSVLIQKPRGVSTKSLLRGRNEKASLKEKNGLPSLSCSLSTARALLTKAAHSRVEINSMEPPDESKEEKEQRKTEAKYFTKRKAKITNGYWLVFQLCPRTLTVQYKHVARQIGGRTHKLTARKTVSLSQLNNNKDISSDRLNDTKLLNTTTYFGKARSSTLI